MSDTDSRTKGFAGLPMEVKVAILEGLVDFEKVPIEFDEDSCRFFFDVNHAAFGAPSEVSQLAAHLYDKAGLVHISFKGEKRLSPTGMIPEIEESPVRSFKETSEPLSSLEHGVEPFKVVTAARPLMPHVMIEDKAAERGDPVCELTTTLACAKAYFFALAAQQLPMLPPVLEGEARPVRDGDNSALQPSTFDIAIAMMGSRVRGQTSASLVQLHERVCRALRPLAHPSNTLTPPAVNEKKMPHVAELRKAFEDGLRDALAWLVHAADVVEHRKHLIDRLTLTGNGEALYLVGDGDSGFVLLATQLQSVLGALYRNQNRWRRLIDESGFDAASKQLARLLRLQVSIAYNLACSERYVDRSDGDKTSALTSTKWCVENIPEEIVLLCPCHLEVTNRNFKLEPDAALCNHRDARFMQIELRRMRILWHYLRGDLDRTPNFGDTKRTLEKLQQVVSNEYGQEHEPLEASLRIVEAAYERMNRSIAAASANNPVAESDGKRMIRNGGLFSELPLEGKLSHHHRYTFSPISAARGGALCQADFALRATIV